MKKYLITLTLILCQIAVVSAKNYYIDSVNGSDKNKGISPSAPWQTLKKANSKTFKGGDTIRFVNGGEWYGIFEPRGSGSKGKPIVVESYGPGLKRPKIDAQGREGKAVIYLSDQQYWEISDLELTNDAPEEGDRRGIWIVAEEGSGILSHIHLKNLHIHHIKGIVGQGRIHKRTSGIAFSSQSNNVVTRFDDILIDGCVIHDCDNQGIITECTGKGNPYPKSAKWNNGKYTNVRITNNLLYNISKNAMILRYFEDGIVEHNLCYDTAIGTGDGRGMTGNTIFTANCDGTIFQFNEGYGNQSPHGDGSLYDADLRSPNTIWQYSLSHDNAHGLFWGCTVVEDDGIICRYNVSCDDRGIIFCVNYPVKQMDIHNNTVIIGDHRSPAIISERGVGGDKPRFYTFTDNVIYGGDRYFSYILANQYYTRKISNNLFFGGDYVAVPGDEHKAFGDVMLSKKALPGGALFNPIEGKGAFSQGKDAPLDFLVMDFESNFTIAGEHIYAGEPLEVSSDYPAQAAPIEVKIFNPRGEAIYSQSVKQSDKYSFGNICSERGLYRLQFTIGERRIDKKLWVL